MAEQDKSTALVVRLNRLTSQDKIQWSAEDPPAALSRGTDSYIPFYLTSRYKDQTFGLFNNRFQSYDGETDRFYWNESTVLAILDAEGRSLLEISSPWSALSDLLETARRKVAGIDGLLDSLLSDDA